MEQNLNNNRTTDKIPHSFHLGEQPVQEFDNTSLEEAVEKGYIATPDHVHDLIVTERLPVEAQPAVEKKSKKGLILGATAGMAGVAIAAGAFIGLNSGDSSEAAPETPPQSPGTEEVVPEVPVEDTATTPETPVEQEMSYEQLVERIKIPAGLSAEEYAKTLIDSRLTNWTNAGTGEDLFNGIMEHHSNSTEPISTFYEQKAEEASTPYIEALFIPDYEDVPSLKNTISFQISSTAITYTSWMKTYDYDNSMTTPEWFEGLTVTSVETLEEDPENQARTIYVRGYQYNNASDSLPDSVNAHLNGKTWDHTITTRVIDGVEYIADWAD